MEGHEVIDLTKLEADLRALRREMVRLGLPLSLREDIDSVLMAVLPNVERVRQMQAGVE
jgi:hypothetical protein